MKKLFLQIEARLKSFTKGPCEGHELKRLHNLSGFITGMIRKGSSHLADIGSGLPQNINANSKTTSAKRFVENKWTDFDLHFLPCLAAFIKGVFAFTLQNQPILLVIDGSQIGKDNAALMISLVWRNRGIPICWHVKKGGKGHFKGEDHLKVVRHAMEILLPLFPDDIPVTLLGDGEFDGIELQKLCLSKGWNYVLRTALDSVFFENGNRFQPKQLLLPKEENCLFIPTVEFTEMRFKYVNFVYWHDQKKYEKPIFLVSNLPEVGDIIEFYDQRYSIECLFKDLKSTSFNLHKTRLKAPLQIFNLIIVAALAFIMLTVLAIQYDEPFWRKKVQRVRKDRKVLSFFTFAYKLIDHFLDYHIDFNFPFQFSKNALSFYSKNE